MRTHLRTKLLTTAALGTGLAILAAGPVSAATTTTTFTLTGGGLSISAPASSNLAASGTVSVGTAGISANLGSVSVTDDRGSLLGTWTASAVSTDFTTGSASADETIAKANVSYTSGLGTSSGVGVDVPSLMPVAIGSSATVFERTGIVGVGSTSWDPTIDITVPADAVAGTYSGTITHSVA